jgi:hypothetical protein
MMNDSLSVELRQHLLATADERPGDGRLAAIVEGVAVTGQRRPLVARLPWSPARTKPFPSRAVRYGLIAVALLVAIVAAALFAGGGFQSRTVFNGTWSSTDPADGSSQTLIIGAGTRPTVHFEDDYATGLACRNDAVKVFTADGMGEISDDRLDASFPDGGGCGSMKVEIAIRLVHDADTDSLRDQDGVSWARSRAARPTLQPTTAPSVAAESPRSGSMWPQSTTEEVQAAQDRADAGDAAYTWQVDPGLSDPYGEWWAYISAGGVDIVERFLREKLGWDQFLFNAFLPLEYTTEEGVLQVAYVRCAPGKTNTLYKAFPEGDYGASAASCAPTIDALHYETVLLDLKQPGKTGPTGVWVVERWTMLPPFAQTDPVIAEAEATARLKKFLEARVAGNGAEGYVDLVGVGSTGELPLLYTTSAGAPYERSEFELVSGPEWPFADMEFHVRLFAQGGKTVVEQPIRWADSKFSARARETTENGQPVAVPYGLLGGLVRFSAADPWHVGLERSAMELGDKPSEAVILLGDPRASGRGCGVSPASVDAEALARSLGSDPDLQATAPVAVTVGGLDAIEMDIGLAPAASICEGLSPVLRLSDASDYGSDRRAVNLEPGARMRLFLVDLPESFASRADIPEGSASRIVTIAVVAPEARFDSVLEAATPIIDSIEFK